ncbi:hypothetical protein HPHPH11_0429 [Helicobacter pylori Hp H-11]|nr:hypothetical protein HPHPH11_0429 [Helicobacter pylori Hp H-11]RVY90302.1 hypothetical protein EC503_05195 [Helicobacter pylori]
MLFENYGAFKSYEVIVCCLIPSLILQRRERFGTSFMGAVVGLEAREQAHSRFFNLTLSGRRNP